MRKQNLWTWAIGAAVVAVVGLYFLSLVSTEELPQESRSLHNALRGRVSGTPAGTAPGAAARNETWRD